LHLSGLPIIQHTVQAFLDALEDIEIILVLPKAHLAMAAAIIPKLSKPGSITIIEGGATRFHSVKNGLAQIDDPAVVFIHDGVRPLVSSQLIHSCREHALKYGNAIPAIPMKDSVRQLFPEEGINKAVNREHYKIIQTPQTFLSEIIVPAFETTYNESFTDEATVIEQTGHAVHLVDGEEGNIKITRPLDLIIAESLLNNS